MGSAGRRCTGNASGKGQSWRLASADALGSLLTVWWSCHNQQNRTRGFFREAMARNLSTMNYFFNV